MFDLTRKHYLFLDRGREGFQGRLERLNRLCAALLRRRVTHPRSHPLRRHVLLVENFSDGRRHSSEDALRSLLGVRPSMTFGQPYLSASITEFWQRSHISHSSWLHDYVCTDGPHCFVRRVGARAVPPGTCPRLDRGKGLAGDELARSILLAP